ncbi:Phage antirepressor protein [Cardiobacterium hominis]|uniref:Phage antirepressor protein n=1 Tax=Cardiobacterium hominis TaxID=2718 RepID=A0A1C3H730_9GAMM|nr:antA/AntB antirepressor family protein [Cardiobacterium hominis]SAM71673.1 Phage antirepressor protein [Cardiobacterium hominis]
MTHPTPAASGDLIPTFNGILDGIEQPLVDARTLHAFLEVGRDFSNWIKARIFDYDFVENQDYVLTLAKKGERQNVIVHEYHLTLDMAKELAMVERSERGRQVRRYFIALEKRVLVQKDSSRLLWLIDELQDAYCQAHPEALKLLRYRRLGLSQKEIGRLLGVSRQTVSARLKRLAALGFGDNPQLALPGIATREV